MQVIHPIPPIFDSRSRVLILGSFPSVKSREAQFYYGHPQNRFWRVLAAVLDAPAPETVPEKTAMLLSHGIALWDVIASCEITGSSDASIRNAAPNDLSPLLAAAPIERIFCNGALAWKLYEKHLHAAAGRGAVQLPSTSPANAQWPLPRLIEAWQVVNPAEE